MKKHTLYFDSRDGITGLHAVRYEPEDEKLQGGKPPGVLQIVHGMSEHMGRYEETARFFTERGFVVTGDPQQAELYYSDTQARNAINESLAEVRAYSMDERVLSQLKNAMQLRDLALARERLEQHILEVERKTIENMKRIRP